MKRFRWSLNHVAWITAAAFTAILYFRLGRDYLFDWDESIYGALGRGVVESGNWLTPTWNGALWLEKPPLIAWLTAVGIKLFGATPFAVRAAMPLAAGLTLLGLYRLGKRQVGPRFGLMAMSLLGYFDLFLSRARTVNTDILLLAAMTWTVDLTAAGSAPLLAGVVAGLAVMAKGPAGLLAVLVSLPFWRGKSRAFIWRFAAAFALTAVPWHLYQLAAHGREFYTPYLLEQVIRRVSSPIEFHLESRWFYFLFLYRDLGLGMITGAVLGLALILRFMHRGFIFAWWAGLPLVLFTLAKTRLSWYILPAYPAIAGLIAAAPEAFSRVKRVRPLLTFFAVAMAANTLWHAALYVEPVRRDSKLPDLLVVARSLSAEPGDVVAMLVPQSERTAAAILPPSQTISSSFRYGGAPAVYWYAGKYVEYFYDYNDFSARLASGEVNLAITAAADTGYVPAGFNPRYSTPGYTGYTASESYADR